MSQPQFANTDQLTTQELQPTQQLTKQPIYFQRSAQIILFVLFIGSFIDKIHMDLRTLDSKKYNSTYTPYKICEKLKQRHKDIPWEKGIAFRTQNEIFPSIGLCFGIRTNSIRSPYGIYLENQKIPDSCQSIDKESQFILTKC